MTTAMFDAVRTRTVRFVTTYDLMMACAKHHHFEGTSFGRQIMPFFKLMDNVHAAIINDLSSAYREAADRDTNGFKL